MAYLRNQTQNGKGKEKIGETVWDLRHGVVSGPSNRILEVTSSQSTALISVPTENTSFSSFIKHKLVLSEALNIEPGICFIWFQDG